MEITINNQQYQLKYSIRALLIFEQLTGKMFEIKSLTDEYIFLYSLLIANNKESSLTFDELIDAMDEDASIMPQYQHFILQEMKKQEQFKANNSNDNCEKKN